MEEKANPEIVVLGAAGQLGSELCALLPEGSYFGKNRETLDISDWETVDIFLRTVRPQFVVNCASTSSFRRTLTDSAAHQLVNAASVANLAKACRINGCKLIHVSDGEILGGSGKRAHVECDCANPEDAYAVSKAAGEHAILSVATLASRGSELQYWIIRASMIVGPRGRPSFLDYLGSVIHSSRTPFGLSDQVVRSPVHARTLAQELLWLLKNHKQIPHGTYHVGGRGFASLLEIAQCFVGGLRDARHAPLVACDYEDFRKSYPCFSTRNGALNCDCWQELTGRKMPGWSRDVHTYARELGRV